MSFSVEYHYRECVDTSVCVGGRVRPLPVPVLPLTCLLMCLQLLYYKGIERGVLPYIKFGEILVYTISTSIVFHAVRPHSVRSLYGSAYNS